MKDYEFMKGVQLCPLSSILHLGCGYGDLVTSLQRRHTSVRGADIAMEELVLGRTRYGVNENTLSLYDGTLLDHAYDCVIITDFIECLDDAGLDELLYKLDLMKPKEGVIIRTAVRENEVVPAKEFERFTRSSFQEMMKYHHFKQTKELEPYNRDTRRMTMAYAHMGRGL